MPTKIKLTAPVIHGATTRKAGEVIEVEDQHAKNLIARKLATPAVPERYQPRPAKDETQAEPEKPTPPEKSPGDSK